MFSELVLNEKYSVIGLSETWLDNKIDNNNLCIHGYNLVRNDREIRAGGVAFYVSNIIQFKTLDIPNTPDLIEQLWISIKIGNIKGKRICLGTLYRPPRANLTHCIDVLETTLVNILPDFDLVLFGGDLNVDLLNNDCYTTKQLKRLFDKYNLHQLITKPTRITQDSKTLIDVLVSSCLDVVLNADAFPMDCLSDHHLVTCNLKISKPKQLMRFNYNSFLYLIDFDHILYSQ